MKHVRGKNSEQISGCQANGRITRSLRGIGVVSEQETWVVIKTSSDVKDEFQ